APRGGPRPRRHRGRAPRSRRAAPVAPLAARLAPPARTPDGGHAGPARRARRGGAALQLLGDGTIADFDLIVLGSGPAGEKGAAQAAYFGKRVAVVECAPEPGGAAVHTGTLPSKTLRETSVYLSGYHQRELYGISVEITPEHAAPRLLSRKDAVRQAGVARIRSTLDRHGVTMVAGRARFVAPHPIEIVRPDGVQRLTAEIVLIATGSIPHRPADIDFNDPDIEDSDTVLHLDRMPSSLTVLGAGVIGCEYATMFAALGVPVQLVEPRDHILPFLDEDIGLGLLKAMAGLGITPHLGDSWASARRVPGRGIVTTLKRGGEVVSYQLLFAAGRSGNTRGLGLETIGVKTGKRDYVEVDGSYRTSVPN